MVFEMYIPSLPVKVVPLINWPHILPSDVFWIVKVKPSLDAMMLIKVAYEKWIKLCCKIYDSTWYNNKTGKNLDFIK